jgi:hypothetical protein
MHAAGMPVTVRGRVRINGHSADRIAYAGRIARV